MRNPIFALIQSLPINGWTTALAGVGSLAFGIGGILNGQLETETAMSFILVGLAALGIGNKLDKAAPVK